MRVDAVKLPNQESILRGRSCDTRGGRPSDTSLASSPARPFNLKPSVVTFDRNLSARAKYVYDVLLHFRHGVYVDAGERLLSQAAHMCRRSFRKDIACLISAGRVKRQATPKSRARYFLVDLPAVFEFIAAAKKEALEEAPPIICPQCGRTLRAKPKFGICRNCRSTKKMEQISRRVAQEEIARSAA